ncbi:MAG: polymer-forming cytoskeletal protein [Desulfobacterales bacterium]
MAWFKKSNGGEDPIDPVMPQPSSKNGTTYLGKNLSISGSITGRDSVQISGRHEGDIQVDGHLDIREPAVVRGSLKAASITVAGTAEGDLLAASRLKIDRTGVVTGTISTSAVAFQEGAVFNGDIKMRD